MLCSEADQCLKLHYERSTDGNIYWKGCAVLTQCSSATRPECKTWDHIRSAMICAAMRAV